MLATFLGLNPKGPYLVSLEKGKKHCVVLTYSIKQASEIRKFRVAVVEQRSRNVQKSVMHLQSRFLLRLFPNRIYENDRELHMVAHWFAEEMTQARISK